MARISDETRDAIMDAVRDGQKIRAIKLYREATGEGLKESKDFIEELQARLHEEIPDEYPDSSKGGCTTMLIVAVLVVGAAVFARSF